MDSLVGFNNESQKVLGNYKKLFDQLAEYIEDAEDDIHELINVESKFPQNTNFNDNYFPKFDEAKQYLRDSLQKIRQMAGLIVTEVRGVKKKFLESLNKRKKSIFLKSSIDKMKDLMISTLDTMNLTVGTMVNLISSIETQNRKLSIMVQKNSAEYKAWKEKTRVNVYGTSTGFTIGMIIVDLLGCLGICSATNLVLTGSTAAAVERAIAEYSAELEKFKAITGKMLESGRDVDDTITEAIEILNTEIDLIDELTNSAETASDNINIYPEEMLRKYVEIREILIEGLTDLENAATNFLVEPINIF